MSLSEPISYFIFQDKTMFIPLRFVYPECFFHIKDSPQLYPLKCFVEDACPAKANCADVLVNRVHYLFEKVAPNVDIIIAYYKYHDRPNSIRGAVFRRSLDPPTISILNPYAFRKFQREGIVYQWLPTNEYSFMGGSKGLVQIKK